MEAPREGRFHFGVVPWAASALLIMSWLTGDHFLPWVSWHSESPVFLAALLLAWNGMWRVWRPGGPRAVAVPYTVVPFLLLLVIVVAQRVVGLDPFTGDVWVLFFYCAFCVILLASGHAISRRAIDRPDDDGSSKVFELLAWTILAGALASTALEFAQVFDVWDAAWLVRMPEVRRPGANLAQPNHLATLQVMAVASVVYLRGLKRIGASTLGIVLSALCFGLAASESRAGALSLLLLFGWCAWKRNALRLDRGVNGPLLWAAAFCAMFVAWPYLLDSTHLLQYTAQPRVAEANLRLVVWPQLLKAVAMKPWQGWGFHQVAAAQNAAITQGAAPSDAYTYSHNLVLDLVVWLGVPVGLCFTAAGALYFVRRMRAASQLLPAYILAIALPLIVHSMVEYPYAYAYLLAPPIFMLGALEGIGKSKPLLVGALPATALLIFITGAMTWSAVEYLGIEEDFRVARFESLHIGSVPPEYHQPQIRLFDQLALLTEDARITPEPGMRPEALEVLRRAALYYPWLATQYRYASALALNGRPQEAKHQLDVIHAMWGDKVYSGIEKKIAASAADSNPALRPSGRP